MSVRQTRRQAALAAANEPDNDGVSAASSANDEVHSPMNGSGNGQVRKNAGDHPDENIFLFWPNIIGTKKKPGTPPPTQLNHPEFRSAQLSSARLHTYTTTDD